jgi:RND superfamily putative drug exporter
MSLQGIARTCYRRRRYVLAAWLLALVAVSVLSHVAAGKDTTTFSLPGTESERAFDLLAKDFPARSGDTADIVFEATGPGGVRAPAVEARMKAAFAAALAANPDVTSVASPYSPQGARQVSADGQVAFATLQLDVRSQDAPKGMATAI